MASSFLQNLKVKYADVNAKLDERDALSKQSTLLKHQIDIETMFETTEKDVVIITPNHSDFTINENWTHEPSWIDSGLFKAQTKESNGRIATWEYGGVKHYCPYLRELSWVVDAAYDPYPPHTPFRQQHDYFPCEFIPARTTGIKQDAKKVFFPPAGAWGYLVDDWAVTHGLFKAMIHRYQGE